MRHPTSPRIATPSSRPAATRTAARSIRPSPRALTVLCLCLLPALAACDATAPGPAFEAIRIGGQPWRLEVVADDAARTRGLSGRSELPADGGMLFVFPDAQLRSFWMYDCLIPIDLIFLDRLGAITALHEMPIELPRGESETELAYESRLPRYSSRLPAQFAIELPAGSIRALGLRPNTRIEIDADRLKRHLR